MTTKALIGNAPRWCCLHSVSLNSSRQLSVVTQGSGVVTPPKNRDTRQCHVWAPSSFLTAGMTTCVRVSARLSASEPEGAPYLAEDNLRSQVLGSSAQRPRPALDALGEPEVGDLRTYDQAQAG